MMEKKSKTQWEEVRKEREILSRSASQWIVRLYCCFQDAKYLYMAMEYAPGGDMRHMLLNLGILDEPTAAFYFTEMCLAVDYLHSLGYVHRDLKPSNFVIDAHGHIKLIDCKSLKHFSLLYFLFHGYLLSNSWIINGWSKKETGRVITAAQFSGIETWKVICIKVVFFWKTTTIACFKHFIRNVRNAVF